MRTHLFRTACGSTLLLVAATLLGVVVAALTQSDRLRGTGINKPVLCFVHALILGIWTAAWLGFWRHALHILGGWPLAAFVALTAAAMAEVIQLWWPGHYCDWVGLICNLTGVLLVLLGRRLLNAGTALLPEP